MAWLEAFHIIFVVTWFAGLFYLPRLFVYASLHPQGPAHEVLLTMQGKLLGITHIGGALALGFGTALVATHPHYLQFGWMHAKLSLVILLVAYHLWCWRLVAVFRKRRNTRSHTWFRWFNEVPALLLVAIVVLVVVRPF